MEEGHSLDEIASKRGLTTSTIVGHIERIAAQAVFIDVSHMVPKWE